MTKETNEVSGKVNSFFDRGEGVVEFPNGLVITDDSTMWSGTKYDIETLDVSEYPGQLTLDHTDSIEDDCLIGKVEGVRKQGNKITVDRIRYAIDISKNAMRAYQLLVGGFSNAFSIETVGPWADDETHTMYNHKLVGLSQVVMGNNKHAVANSIKPIANQVGEFASEDKENCSAIHEVRVEECEVEAQVEEGEDVAKVEETPAETEAIEALDTKAEEVIKDLPLEDKEEVAEVAEEAEVEEEVVETEPSDDDDKEVVEESEEEAAEKVEEESETEAVAEAEDQAEEVAEEATAEAEEETPARDEEFEKEVEEAEKAIDEEIAEEETAEPAEEEAQEDTNINNKVEETEMTKEEISKLINEAFKNFAEAQAAAPVAEEPAVEEAEAETKEDNSYSLEKHVNLVMRALKTKSALDYDALARVNRANLDALKAEGIVANTMTIEDWGNFVLPPEMYRRIIGKRTDYSVLLDATDWRETDRLEFAWLTRNGDIEMSNVDACENHPVTAANKNKNLKPITTYGAVRHIEQMEHLGAVTPICTAATKYLIVDMLGDAIAGYRNNYDKKRAQLVIAKLQEAVNLSGNKVHFDATATAETKLATFIETLAQLSDATSTGTFIFTEKTLLKVMEYVTPRESALGDRCFDTGKDGIKRIFGTPYIVVPNELMPSLDRDGTNPVFSYIPVDAASTAPQNIEITSTVFYGNLSEFIGYTSGGLQFDMTEYAAYEDANGVVRSAYQRDEIVLRGYFWRGAAYRDPSQMAAITNEVASN